MTADWRVERMQGPAGGGRMTVFHARFPSRCASCDERIHAGDHIRMTDDGAIHDDCQTVATPDEPTRPACPACWLIHPEGACDR